jgi:hypothetical protein
MQVQEDQKEPKDYREHEETLEHLDHQVRKDWLGLMVFLD